MMATAVVYILLVALGQTHGLSGEIISLNVSIKLLIFLSMNSNSGIYQTSTLNKKTNRQRDSSLQSNKNNQVQTSRHIERDSVTSCNMLICRIVLFSLESEVTVSRCLQWLWYGKAIRERAIDGSHISNLHQGSYTHTQRDSHQAAFWEGSPNGDLQLIVFKR